SWSCPVLFYVPWPLNQNVLHADSRQGAAMSLGAAHALPALLLENPDLGTARLAVDDAHDLDVGDERRSGQHLAAVLFKEQDAVDAHLFALFGVDPIDGDHTARRHLHLTAAALDDCEHDHASSRQRKTLDYHGTRVGANS